MDIEKLAREAGYEADMFGMGIWHSAELRRFAALVAEDCAKTVEAGAEFVIDDLAAAWCAAVIRERFKA